MNRPVLFFASLWLALTTSFTAPFTAPFTASAHEKGDEKLPEPPVSMHVVAPSARGPWLLRIDNQSDEPVVLAADVRLLRFEVRVPSKDPVRQTYAHGWTKRATVCDGPGAFAMNDYPADRELVLEPGHSYIEEFDPRLICFGKDADLLVPGAMVKPSMGWKPKSHGTTKFESAPFVIDAAHRPRHFRPLRRLEAPSMVLSHAPPAMYGPGDGDAPRRDGRPPAAEGAPNKGEKQRDGAENKPAPADKAAATEAAAEEDKPRRPRTAEQASRHQPRPEKPRRPRPPEDELSARTTLTSSRYADAVRPTDVQLSVQAHNTGERPIFVALRSRMLGFQIEGPNGVSNCRLSNAQHEVPRDLFATLHHGKHVHMDVMLAEMCPPGTFDRPGLYLATPTLYADANGKQYGLQALTGVITPRDPGDPGGTHQRGDDATLIRLRQGRAPFYRDRPQPMPTRVLPK